MSISSPKLKAGDEIRIIAPARSMSIISQQTIEYAEKFFNSRGIKVSYGKHVMEKDVFTSSSIKSRIEDLHNAFFDQQIKGILTIVGGFNCNQLLSYIDYDLIKKNPKVFCGYSDITSLSNAITAKTGLITYYGPHFSTFWMQEGNEYTQEYFQKALFPKAVSQKEYITILPSPQRSDDQRYIPSVKREFYSNPGYVVINEGFAEWTIYGGHLSTFQLLFGTEYMPNLENSILLLEESEEFGQYTDVEFDRILQSLIHQPGFKGVKGILIGRFQKVANMNLEKLTTIIKSKKELDHITVVADINFWHATPIATFPIGWNLKLKAEENNVNIQIMEC